MFQSTRCNSQPKALIPNIMIVVTFYAHNYPQSQYLIYLQFGLVAVRFCGRNLPRPSIIQVAAAFSTKRVEKWILILQQWTIEAHSNTFPYKHRVDATKKRVQKVVELCGIDFPSRPSNVCGGAMRGHRLHCVHRVHTTHTHIGTHMIGKHANITAANQSRRLQMCQNIQQLQKWPNATRVVHWTNRWGGGGISRRLWRFNQFSCSAAELIICNNNHNNMSMTNWCVIHGGFSRLLLLIHICVYVTARVVEFPITDRD